MLEERKLPGAAATSCLAPSSCSRTSPQSRPPRRPAAQLKRRAHQEDQLKETMEHVKSKHEAEFENMFDKLKVPPRAAARRATPHTHFSETGRGVNASY